MSWIYLLIAGILEMGWAVGLKYTHGFFTARAQRPYVGRHGRQLRLFESGPASSSHQHGLCHLDGYRHRRNRHRRLDFLSRIPVALAGLVGRSHCRRHRWTACDQRRIEVPVEPCLAVCRGL